MYLFVRLCFCFLTVCCFGIHATYDQIFPTGVPTTGQNPGGFGPGGSLADMYCAYCRQRGWTDCIQRYCFGRAAFGGMLIRNQGRIIANLQAQQRFLKDRDIMLYLRLKRILANQ